jgi:Zn-dependent oligopeptidase
VGFLLIVWGCVTLVAAPERSWEQVQLDCRTHGCTLQLPTLPTSSKELRSLIKKERALFASSIVPIENLPLGDQSFNSTVGAVDSAFERLQKLGGLLYLICQLEEDSGLGKLARRGAVAVAKDIYKFYLNRKLYQVFNRVKGLPGLGQEETQLLMTYLDSFWFTSENIKETLDNFEMSGLLDALTQEVSDFEELAVRRQKIRFSPADLAGLSQSALSFLEPDAEGYLLDPSQWIQYDQVMRYAELPETRKRVWDAIVLGAPKEAAEKLAIILAARKRLANRYQYASWSAYVMDGMSSDAKNLKRRFRQYQQQSEEAFAKEREQLRLLLGHDAEIWDVEFATQKARDQIGLNEEEVRSYFSFETVLEGAFDYIEKVFGYSISALSDREVWSGAKAYVVYHASSGKPLGTFTLDAFPRAGKGNWFMVLPLASGQVLPDHTWERPLAHLHLNFAPPREGQPSLLNFDEVWTLFHELGHLMHFLVSNHRYPGLAPASTNGDLVEFPSTLFEQLAWEPEVIRKLARHWQSAEPMPEALIQKLAASKSLFLVHGIRHRMAQSVMDLSLHSARPPKGTGAEDRAFASFYYRLPERTQSVASGFSYLSEYDSTYWTYLWAAGMASQYLDRFRAASGGAFDTEVAETFKASFLEQGGRYGSHETLVRTMGKNFNLCRALLTHSGLRQSGKTSKSH